MSFLDLFRCILCCEEDRVDQNDYSYYSSRSSIRTSNVYEAFLPHRGPTSAITTRDDHDIGESFSYVAQAIKKSKNALIRGTCAGTNANVIGDVRTIERNGQAVTRNPVSVSSQSVVRNVQQSNDALRGTCTGSTTNLPRIPERNHEVSQSSNSVSSQTTYTLRSSSMPPDSSSSSSKCQYLQPPNLYDPFKLQPKPVLVSSKSISSVPKSSSPQHSHNTLFPPKLTSLDSSGSASSPLGSSSPSVKPFLSPQQAKNSYAIDEKFKLPIYKIPQHIMDMIKNDIVPGVLKAPLSPSTYVDHFSALLYAEDYYIEKWSKFLLENVTLEIEKVVVGKHNNAEEKVFVKFLIDRVPERRPFLISRDFVFAKPVGSSIEPFQGVIYRVVKSTKVLVDFGIDFHRQHSSRKQYNISFSFNRVCLKRAHQAVASASAPSFKSFLFPDLSTTTRASVSSPVHYHNHRFKTDQNLAVEQILQFKGSPPYLVEGPLAVSRHGGLSETGKVVCEATIELCRRSRESKILICAPTNTTLDTLLRSLSPKIPEAEMFRANAAFREIELVPDDILASSLYNDAKDCFFCPDLQELKKYRVVLATFVSAFRLRSQGLSAGHFGHVFLVDASSAPEPDLMVALANVAVESTSVVVTGNRVNHPSWVRSPIARRNGLRVSYFERLCKEYPYEFPTSDFYTKIKESVKPKEDGIYSYQ